MNVTRTSLLGLLAKLLRIVAFVVFTLTLHSRLFAGLAVRSAEPPIGVGDIVFFLFALGFSALLAALPYSLYLLIKRKKGGK